MSLKKRISIARALVRHPKILILNRVFRQVDKNDPLVAKVIKELIESKSYTVLVATDDLELLDQMDEIVILHAGAKVESGSPAELMRQRGCYFRLHDVNA